MRLCAAQCRSVAGDVATNLAVHLDWIARAATHHADFVLFPELSLTGYEPRLAKMLATTARDARFDVFQAAADSLRIQIGVGMPLAGSRGIEIGMLLFLPDHPRQSYSKQRLHTDELPYFVCGTRNVVLTSHGRTLAPAICYESLQADHAEKAARQGADIYLASVAKSAGGVARAAAHYPEIARRHALTVLMANGVGPCDNFVAAGQSAIFDPHGDCLARLAETVEGLLIFDTETNEAAIVA